MSLSAIQADVDALQRDIEAKQERREYVQLIRFIENCESGGNPNAQSKPEHADGTRSWGLYQFNWKTWQVHAEKYAVLKNATGLSYWETVDYMLKPQYNAAVAHAMLRDGLAHHWKNCYREYLLKKSKLPTANS